jgi:hypothetical protein
LTHAGTEAVLWDPTGDARRAELADVAAVHHAALSEELGLALVEVGSGALVVYDLAAGQDLARVDAPAPRHAAWSPDRALLAVSDGREIAVFEVASGEALARWTVASVAGLAFRQDGAVLFSGERRPLPERAWDPRTGEARDDARLAPALLERVAAGQLDPGWRWSAHPDGWFTRTLDGRELYTLSGGALTDNGLVSGAPDVLSRYNLRIGPDPRGPVYEPAQLATVLDQPNLVEAFFTGAELVTPSLTPEEAAAAAAAD